MRFRVVSAATLLAAVPGISSALGLGDETVRSYLNAPLNAEIELLATSEELATVQVQLASREDFIRHGLDYPGFLTGIQVRTERLPDGRNVIRLSSSQAILEPFLVLLVDVRTNSGRLLREYTLLLDPPTFQTRPAPAAPVAVPGTGDPRATTIQPPPAIQTTPAPRPVPQPAPVQVAPPPAAVSPPPPAPAGGGGSYTVRRGDTLSRIASREYGAGQASQAMIAIYRANPRAFNGNINLLEAGASLELPDQAAVGAISRGEAAAEVRSQMTAWVGSTPAAPEAAEARLRLVPPGGPAGTGTGEGDQSGTGTTPAPATPDRPVTVENPDLARLQGQKPAETPAPTEPATPAEGDVDVSELGVTEPAPAEAQVAEPAPAPAQPEPAPATPPATEGPGLLDRLMEYKFFAIGALGLIGALLALVAVRRRRAATQSFAPLAPTLDELVLGDERDTSADTFPLRKPADSRDSAIVVEETGEHERPASLRRETQTVDLEEGGSSATMTAAALEQGDPLAEADFHMAYGLYDQAADLVKAALKREPQRRDLKLKLLEVFFVWGNKDQFLQTARELGKSRENSPPGEWEKVIIMGKQLAPEDVLFHNPATGGAQTSVDLNLEGGQNLIDFDLPEAEGTPSDSGVDLKLTSTDTGLQPLDAEGGIDLLFDSTGNTDMSAATATTRQMAQPGLDAINAPTVEQPALDVDDTLAGKVDAHGLFAGSPDQTAELAIDDLGLDLGKLEATGTGLLPPVEEAAPDAPTMVAGLDETSRELLASADASQRTEMLPLTDLDLGGATGIDLDINFSSGDTGKAPHLGGSSDLDLDVGEAAQPESDWQSTQRIDPTLLDVEPRELEPVTMSEVGTKLDLARAYMDMGDPDGARSILNEVLQEGSESQCKEAQRLLDSIPG